MFKSVADLSYTVSRNYRSP